MMLTYAEIRPVNNSGFKVANVFFVVDDMVYIKGDICKRRDGGLFISVANSPWKDKENKSHNNYLAGILDDDAKTKLESYILSLYTSGQYEHKTANMVNLNKFRDRIAKISANGNNKNSGSSQQSGLTF